MEDVFPPCHVFINHRGPDVKKTLASLIYHALDMHGLRVFLDEEELRVGDSITPAIQSAIRSASVHIAIFSKTYAQSSWCLDELLWMFDSDITSTKIIPVFYDIDPSALRHIEKGAYATAFEEHRQKKRYTDERVERWIEALKNVSGISGVVFRTETDDHGRRLKEIVEIVLEKVGREKLHVCEYPVGLLEAAEHFKKEVLNRNELNGTHVVGIVGLGGSGKSTLATHLYNCMRSRFQRCCFLSEVSKNDLPSLQETLLRNLLRDQSLHIDQNTRKGKSLIQDRLRGLERVLIVFDDIDNAEQADNLLFVKDVLGNGSLILVTSRNQALFVSSTMEIYNIRLLDAKHAQELFCWHAFGNTKPLDEFQDMVEKLVLMCGGFPLALKVLAGQFHSERDRKMWKKQLESLCKKLPEDVLKQIIMDSYGSLDVREKEAFLDVAHFLIGEDRDLAERILDGLLDESGFQYLQTLRRKCLLEIEFVDIIRPRALQVERKNRNVGVWRRAKGSFKIRMHDLVRDLARQIGRQELPLRLCCSNDRMISSRVSGSHGSVQQYDVRGIRRDADPSLPEFLKKKDIFRLQLLAVHNFSILQEFKSVSGELTWLRLGQFEDILYPSTVSLSCLRKFPSLSLISLRVLEVHGVSPQNFRNFFDDREPPSQLCTLEVTCTTDFGSVSGAGPSTSISIKEGSASEISDSSQLQIDHGHWFLEWLGKLKLYSLYKIVLQHILGLKTFPIKFEEVRNLRHVDLSGCSDLEYLPDSFTKELLQLQYLALRDCRKLVLEDLGKIFTLEYLDFEGCSLLTEMPKGTEVQKSLKHLNVLRTGLRKLPDNLEQLEDLEELLIGSSELTKIPSSLYNLSRLTVLTLLGCTKLDSIDNSIVNLEHLESFRMYNCGVKVLPGKIAWLNMKILDVQVCPLDSEQLLTGADPGNMRVDSFQAQGSICQSAHPNRSGCLTDLIIRDSVICKIDIPQAESLFPKLEIVDLSNNPHLIEIGRLPGNLISLNLTNCLFLQTLGCLSNLSRLKVLDITGCGEITTLNVEGLRSIQVINANGCWKLRKIEGLDAVWEKLSWFQISTILQFQIDGLFYLILTEGSQIPGGKVLKELKYSKQASVEIKKCYFTDVKPNVRAILLLLLADPKCQIEVEFLGHTYTTQSSDNHSGHILMWSKDSDVFNDFKFSNDEVIHFNFNVLNSPSREQVGWIVEVLDGQHCLTFLNLICLAT